jgi:hypothetical protein
MGDDATDLVKALINACVDSDPGVVAARAALEVAEETLEKAIRKEETLGREELAAIVKAEEAAAAADKAQAAYDNASAAAKPSAKDALDKCNQAVKDAEKALEVARDAHLAAAFAKDGYREDVARAKAALEKALDAARKRCRAKVMEQIGGPVPENESVIYYQWGKKESTVQEDPKRCGICTVTSCMLVWDIDGGPASTESQARKAWESADQLKLVNNKLPDIWELLWKEFNCEKARDGESVCRRKAPCGYKQQPSYIELGALSKSVENPDPDVHEFKWMLYLLVQRRIKCIPGDPKDAIYEPFEPYTALPPNFGHRATDDANLTRDSGD